jgi:hypothetical protein
MSDLPLIQFLPDWQTITHGRLLPTTTVTIDYDAARIAAPASAIHIFYEVSPRSEVEEVTKSGPRVRHRLELPPDACKLTLWFAADTEEGRRWDSDYGRNYAFAVGGWPHEPHWAQTSGEPTYQLSLDLGSSISERVVDESPHGIRCRYEAKWRIDASPACREVGIGIWRRDPGRWDDVPARYVTSNRDHTRHLWEADHSWVDVCDPPPQVFAFLLWYREQFGRGGLAYRIVQQSEAQPY